MTDVSNLDNLAAKIASGRFPNVAAYARAQAIATQAQELAIRKMAEEVEVLKTKAGGGTGGVPPVSPPPTQVAKFFGYVNYAGYDGWPTAHLNDYKFVLGPYLPASTVATVTGGKLLRYMAANSLATAAGLNYGVTYAQANANGWVLTDSSGAQMIHAAYTTNYLGDVGNAGYRAAWCDNVYAMLNETGTDGFMGDDLGGWIQASTVGQATPSQYPTSFAYATNTWYDAIVGFCAYVGAYFRARGKYVSWNAGYIRPGQVDTAALHNSGELSRIMWRDIAQHSDGLMNEAWMAHPGSPTASKIRLAGTVNWHDYWNEYREFHPICTTRGCDFLGLNEEYGYEYGLATFLLDWDGQRGAYFWKAGFGFDYDPWDAYHSTAVALGAPTAAAVKTGDIWTRAFANGSVSVNPVLGTWSIT